jgi:hypothetical protein
MSKGNELLDALHAALENRVVAFNSVRGDFAANVFVTSMVDASVVLKLLPNCSRSQTIVQ